MMDILVIGRGWTGKKMVDELTRRGHAVSAVSHENAINTVANGNFDWVVNCAGVTGVPNVDACELKKKETVQGNAIFPIFLAETCRAIGVRLSHFSSGCIYQGNITSVDAEPNFFGSIYSISKGISDMHLGDLAQVYRIRMPFTNVDEPKNYLTKVLKYAKTGKLYDGGKNSLTDLNEAVSVACDLIETKDVNGYYNLVNEGAVTMNELSQLLQITPQWFTADEFKQATVASRSNCVIPAYQKMRSVHEALTLAIKQLYNNVE